MARPKINIAVDGHSSTGKSTLARQLAAKLSYTYIDTGAMYRAVTLYALRENLIPGSSPDEALPKELNNIQLRFEFNSEKQISELLLNGENVEAEIRTQAVAEQVSTIAAISAVRKHLVAQQQEMAKDGGVVMDGRDIGTVVLPQAELKIFMTASHEVRTKRRFNELREKGQEVSLEEVSKNLAHRDDLDSNRADSPLRQAEGAYLLNNSNLDPEKQLEIAYHWALEKITA